MIRAVIFDMDGLIVDSEPFWAQAEMEIFPKYGHNLTLDDCKMMQGVSIREVVEYWYKVKPWQGASTAQVADEITRRVVELIIEKGELMPGVIDTLEFFKQKGLPMAVASSSAPDLIELVLRKFGILHYFEFFHSAKFEKQGKPAPDVFLTAARKLRTEPRYCLVFEDSYNGILAAKRAGMSVVAVPYPENCTDTRFDLADIKICSLKEWNQDLFKKIQNKLS